MSGNRLQDRAQVQIYWWPNVNSRWNFMGLLFQMKLCNHLNHFIVRKALSLSRSAEKLSIRQKNVTGKEFRVWITLSLLFPWGFSLMQSNEQNTASAFLVGGCFPQFFVAVILHFSPLIWATDSHLGFCCLKKVEGNHSHPGVLFFSEIERSQRNCFTSSFCLNSSEPCNPVRLVGERLYENVIWISLASRKAEDTPVKLM